jgi:hypothetical protein
LTRVNAPARERIDHRAVRKGCGMNSTLTISLDLQDGLLTAHVRGRADELAEGARAVDAIGAESVRLGAQRVLVDLGALGGSMVPGYQLEFEQYAAARLARWQCALVLPAGSVTGDELAPGGAKFAVFGTQAAALGWLQARSAAPMATPRTRPAHSLVHLL